MSSIIVHFVFCRNLPFPRLRKTTHFSYGFGYVSTGFYDTGQPSRLFTTYNRTTRTTFKTVQQKVPDVCSRDTEWKFSRKLRLSSEVRVHRIKSSRRGLCPGVDFHQFRCGSERRVSVRLSKTARWEALWYISCKP